MSFPAAKMIGHVFDRLTVVDRAGSNRARRAMWRCRCACGGEAVRSSLQLRSHGRMGCAACSTEVRSAARVLHGCTKTINGPRERLYKVWQSMRERCEKVSHKAYRWYGARGIAVCDEWMDYAVFREWAKSSGYTDAPCESHSERLSIDRVNNERGYSADNCQWITVSANSRKRHGLEV